MAGPVGVLGGVGDGVGCRGGASAVGALAVLGCRWSVVVVGPLSSVGGSACWACCLGWGVSSALPGLLVWLLGVVRGRDRGGGRSS